MSVFLEHPLIVPGKVERREYQVTLAQAALAKPTLIVLPTGMGKTVIALQVIAETLLRKKGKVLILAPTKPLVEQHASSFSAMLNGKKVGIMTGETAGEDRELTFLENDVIASTPQVVANDIEKGRLDLDKVQLIVYDEAHRAVGNYAYVKVAEAYKPLCRLALAMTASPGSDRDKIMEVCRNLGIEDIQVRTEEDEDVAPYVQDVAVQWVEVELPIELRRISALLHSLYETYIKELETLGFVQPGATTKSLLSLGMELQARLREGEKHRSIYRALSLQAMAMKVEHAVDLCETQGISALRSYLDRLETEALSSDGSKAAKAVYTSEQMQVVKALLPKVMAEHPKISRVMGVVSSQINEAPQSKVLVFTHYRDTCDVVAAKLARVDGVKVAKLFGQGERPGEKGLKQKEQVDVLDRFRSGEFNVLVATSVGEEGLDVESTDLVVFYEPVPSEIRAIQRRGRTGRKRAGKVVILITKGTRDQAYHFSSRNKERSMKFKLEALRKELSPSCPPEKREGQTRLMDF
jgi:Fanconi anemia group M protein